MNGFSRNNPIGAKRVVIKGPPGKQVVPLGYGSIHFPHQGDGKIVAFSVFVLNRISCQSDHGRGRRSSSDAPFLTQVTFDDGHFGIAERLVVYDQLAKIPIGESIIVPVTVLGKIGGRDVTRRPKSDDAHLILEWSGSRGDQRAIQAKGSFLHSGGRPSRIEHVRLPVKMRIVPVTQHEIPSAGILPYPEHSSNVPDLTKIMIIAASAGVVSTVTHNRQPVETVRDQIRRTIGNGMPQPSALVFPFSGYVTRIIGIQPKRESVK